MGRRQAAWDVLAGMHADVALVQEAGSPATSHSLAEAHGVDVWETALLAGRGKWRTAAVRLSDRVDLRRRATVTLEASTSLDDWVVSRTGSVTAADVLVDGVAAFTAVSVYAAWEKVAGRGYADGSAHRILSDLSALLVERPAHRLIVAGDWNLLRGYGENGSAYWKARYDTVFDRAEALGLRFVGPQHPHGRRADPWPEELPADSLCVPTFHHSRQRPETATRQLDFVFASASIADGVTVRALNAPEEWGPSDHCRMLIDVDP